MIRNKKTSVSPFIIFSVVLFLIILLVGSFGFILSMQQIIKTNKSNEMTQMLETEQIRLESSLTAEIAIVLKLANSPIIKKYFQNPDDSELERVALEEIVSYRQAFTGYSIFWLNSMDMIFHSDDNEPYRVDADDPVNYWYKMTLYETELYNFNINYNPDIETSKLWINAPVFDDRGHPTGMVGTGIELSGFVDTIYRNISDRTELYFFISDGKIYGSRDVGLIIAGENITDVLHDTGIDILAETRTLDPKDKRIFDVQNGIVAIGAIPLLDWYYIATMPYSIADYDPAMTVLFLVVLVLLMIIFIIFNTFVAGFLESLRKASENLALVAREREQELIAENDMLDRLNRMKSEFFQNMNHDFKTPLTIVSASVLDAVDMLSFEIDKEEMLGTLSDAQREIMRMGRMVDSAVKQASMYDNRQDMEPIDIAPLLRGSAETHRVLLERHDNTLSLDIPLSLPQIYGNSDMLLHVLSNILSNANRHTRNGEIAIKSITESDTVTIVVRDNGSGVIPEILPHIFERGVSESGTGLGLSICKTAIEAHNGTISVESEPGCGTAVSFTIPIYIDTDMEKPENE